MDKAENKVWLTIIGIGEEGWDGLCPEAQEALRTADAVIGGARHRGLIPDEIAAYEAWPSPMKALVDKIPARRGQKICVLASGNPLFFGIGAHLSTLIPPEEMRIFPHISAFSLICARMKWSEPDTACITACGRPVENLHRALFHKARIVLYSSGPETPHQAAALLCARGFGGSRFSIFEHVGGPHERITTLRADALKAGDIFAPLNSIAIACRADRGAPQYSTAPGLPEAAYDTDGQITKRDIRAAALARLSPRPGQLLWDVGAGSGSVAIEWMRAAHEARAVAVEMNPERCARIRRNAANLGVPRLQIIEGRAPEALESLARPDAIFIGGGITTPGLAEACWAALKPGGRIVANTVTLEGETALLPWHRRHGGRLVRINVEHAETIGGFLGWKPARPIMRWSATKPEEA
ncbi:MAG: cobalamin biosynthesis bifunctional protein CbiET [Hyphomicrobiales bacterium]|nr:MAG: cobalamin biosynthesis bifunctional protein CbiET [Hyphomicrobiales bacterium]